MMSINRSFPKAATEHTETTEEKLFNLFFLCELCGKYDFCKRSNIKKFFLPTKGVYEHRPPNPG